MRNRQRIKLSDVASVIGGGTPNTSVAEYWNGDIPWLSVVDFNTNSRRVFDTEKTITKEGVNNSSTKILNESDLIISARGTVGALAQLARPMAFNQSCFGIRANEKSTNDYLYYAIKNNVNGLKQKSQGSVFSTINMDLLENFDIPLPELKSQRKIADTLSVLDDKIELNNKVNGRLEEMARILYDYWFVQFDFPDENKRPLLSRVLMGGWYA
jgi:type I restriction enzyme S subunit